ncbi:MAG: hypothetical protein LBQ88_05645 [Treponema sp.]|jgi:hypothetical protein|nr:hypothetical protein [Treponema sp.]
MKKTVVLILAVLLVFGISFTTTAEGQTDRADEVRKEANRQSALAQEAAQTSIPIPNVNYFHERRTIAKWASHWDRPSAACYVYLVSYGTVIGYYVSDGKPASTGSLLTPEYREEYVSNGGMRNIQLPDIDGTYGTNNPGIRFFTASGIAVEWAGSGASYIYSDVPLKINVPLLGE